MNLHSEFPPVEGNPPLARATGKVDACLRHGGLILLVIAFALSCWMFWQVKQGGGLAGCSAHGSCSEVLTSRFAKLFGIPVSIFGAVLYLSLFLTSAFDAGRSMFDVRRPLAWTILFGAAWFVFLQLCVLKSFCPWCCTIHLIACTAAVLLLKSDWQSHSTAWIKSPIPHPISALALVSAIATIQYFGPEPETSRVVQAIAPAASGTGESAKATAGENLRVIDGRVQAFGDPSLSFAPSAFPKLHGGPDSLALDTGGIPVLLIHDWTCNHCRNLHHLLVETLENAPRAPGDPPLDVILVPASKEAAGMEVHRIMLTAWLGARPVYAAAENALLDGSLQPEPEAVRAFVSRMNGPSWPDLWKNLAPSVNAITSMGEHLLAASEARLDYSTLPQLVAPRATLVGAPARETLASFLASARADASAPRLPAKAVPVPSAPVASLNPGSSPASPAPQPQPVTNRSAIRFENESLILGSIASGASTVARFRFGNTGTEPLTITGVRASCGCTVPQNWHQTVAPGAQGVIEATFNSAGRPPGPQNKTLTILSNASNKPSALVSFSVEVQPAAPSGVPASNPIAATPAPDGLAQPPHPTP